MFRILSSVLFASILLVLLSGRVMAQEAVAEKPVQQMVGESYLYAIDFLFFTNLAEGELRLSETDKLNVFRAELVGRTLGVASWLTGDRTQTYTSLMELVPGGSLRSIEHSSKIDKRRWGKRRQREHRYRYDYEKGKLFDEKLKEDGVHSKKEVNIPAGQYPVDMLTAFYNLRAGVYGQLVRGSQFMIPTYAKGKFTEIEVNILTIEQQAEQQYFPSHGLLVNVRINPEVFDTDSGNLFVWFDSAGIPERGIVEDVIGLGDVRGRQVSGQNVL